MSKRRYGKRYGTSTENSFTDQWKRQRTYNKTKEGRQKAIQKRRMIDIYHYGDCWYGVAAFEHRFVFKNKGWLFCPGALKHHNSGETTCDACRNHSALGACWYTFDKDKLFHLDIEVWHCSMEIDQVGKIHQEEQQFYE
jgi:hypothetical protein